MNIFLYEHSHVYSGSRELNDLHISTIDFYGFFVGNIIIMIIIPN